MQTRKSQFHLDLNKHTLSGSGVRTLFKSGMLVYLTNDRKIRGRQWDQNMGNIIAHSHTWGTLSSTLSCTVDLLITLGLPWWLKHKESVCSSGDLGFDPWLGRSPGGRNGNPLQYSCLQNSTDRGARGCKESDMTEQLTLILLF